MYQEHLDSIVLAGRDYYWQGQQGAYDLDTLKIYGLDAFREVVMAVARRRQLKVGTTNVEKKTQLTNMAE